jgi:hypothetical protein
MVTGSKKPQLYRVKALLLPPKSASHCGNLGGGAFCALLRAIRFLLQRSLNQARFASTMQGVASKDRGWKRENHTS